jgi:hypothetical protein
MKVVEATKKVCSVKGCTKAGFSLGLCSLHYSRLRRGQTLDADRPPGIANPRRVVIVLPEALYGRIGKKAETEHKPASTFIREQLEGLFP